jgi:hypothetical protein
MPRASSRRHGGVECGERVGDADRDRTWRGADF